MVIRQPTTPFLRTSKCKPTEALGGALSRLVDKPDKSAVVNHMDRKWKYICREMKDEKGSALSVKSDTCKDFPQDEKKDFTLTCPTDMVIAKMGSSYNPKNEVRKYTFTCCK